MSGKAHDRLWRAKETADAVVESDDATWFVGLRRLGAESSIKVQAFLWNWHITQDAAPGLMTQRLLRRRQASQGRSGRMAGFGPSPTRAMVGDVIPLRLPKLELVAALGGTSAVRSGWKGNGMVESMIIMGCLE